MQEVLPIMTEPESKDAPPGQPQATACIWRFWCINAMFVTRRGNIAGDAQEGTGEGTTRAVENGKSVKEASHPKVESAAEPESQVTKGEKAAKPEPQAAERLPNQPYEEKTEVPTKDEEPKSQQETMKEDLVVKQAPGSADAIPGMKVGPSDQEPGAAPQPELPSKNLSVSALLEAETNSFTPPQSAHKSVCYSCKSILNGHTDAGTLNHAAALLQSSLHSGNELTLAAYALIPLISIQVILTRTSQLCSDIKLLCTPEYLER